jgi:hypothetical protein
MADPDFASVKLLLFVDGVEGSTAIVDRSTTANEFTNSGVTLTTAVRPFSTGVSAVFNGSSSIVTTSEDVQWLDELSLTYSFEFWVRFNDDGAGDEVIMDHVLAARRRGTDRRLRILGHSGFLTSTTVLSSGQWWAVGLFSDGTTTRLFINGVQEATASVAFSGDYDSPLDIGAAFGGSNKLNGYLSNLRITDGVCRQTANYTPATAPFEYDAGEPPPPEDPDPTLALPELYYAVLVTDTAEVKVPISTWQGTYQTPPSQSYAQMSMPDFAAHAEVLPDVTTFRIVRRYDTTPEPTLVTMLECPADRIDYFTGPMRRTAVLSGYWTYDNTVNPPPPEPLELFHIQQDISQSGQIRIRTPIRPYCLPGRTVSYNTQSFTVRYVNFIAGPTQAYMDVGA